MKRKTFKKVLGVLGLFASASIVVASCTKTSTRFDQTDDKKLVLASSFSASSPIAVALNDVISQYNKEKPSTDYPVEVFSIAGGYDGGNETVNTKLASKDKTQFFNMIFNYSTVSAQLVRYDQALKLNKGPEAVDTSMFSPRFLQENYEIPGNYDQSVYGVPITRSTEVLVTNVPVAYQLLSQARVNNDLTIASDQATQKLWAEWKMKAQKNLGSPKSTRKVATDEMMVNEGKPTTDQNTDTATVSSNYIKTLWGDYQSVDGGLKGYTFDASALNTTTGLVDLATRIAKSYPNKLKPVNDRKPTDPQGVIGLDSPSNFLFNASFSQVNGDRNQYIIRKAADGKSYDFNALLSNKDNRAEPIKNVFNDIQPLMNANGLFLNNGGNYSSNWGKFHQLAFFISSTSGYYQSFASNSQQHNLVFTGVDASVGTYPFPNFTSNLNAPTKAEYDAGAIGTFNSSRKRYVIYKKDMLTDTLKQTDTNVAFPDETTRQKAEQALSEVLEPMKDTLGTKRNTLIGYIGTNFDISKFDNAVKDKIYAVGNLTNPRFPTAFVLSKDANKVATTTEQTLQADEADIRIAPTKFKSTDEKNIILTQGPSLIGIHANENEDLQTKRFINWLMKGNITIPASQGGNGAQASTGYNGTPLNYIVLKASYILPTRDFLNDPKNMSAGNPYQNIATNAFKSILDDPKYAAYNDVPDFRSGTFRKSIDSALVSANSSKSNFDTFLSNLNKIVPTIVKQN
ncbi:P68 family surface lipoprotein [[Mycoplasma] imitans]|uniref:P68 family surface lipoprotein n=1 Tax=[Mycoplasma] imitans TaxID=29560 RepID=UPI0004880702|nr:P80 family lipoprotein [[Mycoplasma] imitans]